MKKKTGGKGRFWVSVLFRCCNVYQRVYFPAGQDRAQAHCPRCLRLVQFRLTEDGEHGRFFAADD